MLKISKDLFDLLYPVGTYYETSNANWTPSSAGWYGTWQEDTGGKTTVAKSTDTEFNSIGKTGGEKTHKLIADEMPAHVHNLNAFTSGSGSTGRFTGNYEWSSTSSDTESTRWIGDTTTAGSGQPHNNLQPYIVVRRWHRTA